MTAHPRRDSAPTPIILSIMGPSSDDADHDPSRPEARLVTTFDLPPADVALHLEIAWFPPAHATRLRPGPGERLVEGPGGWVGVATLGRSRGRSS